MTLLETSSVRSALTFAVDIPLQRQVLPEFELLKPHGSGSLSPLAHGGSQGSHPVCSQFQDFFSLDQLTGLSADPRTFSLAT